jgi:hypothetical protein
VHESVSHIVTRLIGHNAEKLIALGRASGEAICGAGQLTPVHLRAAVARAREAVESVVVPRRDDRRRGRLGTLVSDAGHTSLVASMLKLLGRAHRGHTTRWGRRGMSFGRRAQLFVSGELEAVRCAIQFKRTLLCKLGVKKRHH